MPIKPKHKDSNQNAKSIVDALTGVKGKPKKKKALKKIGR